MATTAIYRMHKNIGKTVAQCLQKSISYAVNPDKTDNGTYVSAYGCDPVTAEQEFLMTRNSYLAITGRHHHKEVLAYQIRQSFKPGEITPEEANKIGYELASRLLKGKHAFIVATHVNRHHIHSHIIFCNVTLDCTRKYEEDYRSARVVAELSDTLCREHGLSVIEHPQEKGVPYNIWQGENARPSARDSLRVAIDNALQQNLEGFDALMKRLEEAGWKIKHGKQISFKAPDGKRYLRMDTLGPEYTEDSIKAALSGKHQHIAKKPRCGPRRKRIDKLIDIEEKRLEGKGGGYIYTSQKINTKLSGATMSYLKLHGLFSDEQITKHIRTLTVERDTISKRISDADTRLNVIAEMRKTITDYRRTRDVYVQYRQSGWSKQFLSEHRTEIESHLAAKKVYDTMHGQLPLLRDLNTEFQSLVEQKRADRTALAEKKRELHEALNVKSNYETLRGMNRSPKLKSQETQSKQ